LSLIFFPAGLVSLPWGLYAKMTDSIVNRLRAWGVYVLVSVFTFGVTVVNYIVSWVHPSLVTYPFKDITFLVLLSYALGAGLLCFGVASCWIRWIYLVFLGRLPSRRLEIEKGISSRPLGLVSEFIRDNYRPCVQCFVAGVVLFILSLVLARLNEMGWPIP